MESNKQKLGQAKSKKMFEIAQTIFNNAKSKERQEFAINCMHAANNQLFLLRPNFVTDNQKMSQQIILDSMILKVANNKTDPIAQEKRTKVENDAKLLEFKGLQNQLNKAKDFDETNKVLDRIVNMVDSITFIDLDYNVDDNDNGTNSSLEGKGLIQQSEFYDMKINDDNFQLEQAGWSIDDAENMYLSGQQDDAKAMLFNIIIQLNGIINDGSQIEENIRQVRNEANSMQADMKMGDFEKRKK